MMGGNSHLTEMWSVSCGLAIYSSTAVNSTVIIILEFTFLSVLFPLILGWVCSVQDGSFGETQAGNESRKAKVNGDSWQSCAYIKYKYKNKRICWVQPAWKLVAGQGHCLVQICYFWEVSPAHSSVCQSLCWALVPVEIDFMFYWE